MFKFLKDKKIIFLIIFVLVLIPLSIVLATGQGMQITWPRSPMPPHRTLGPDSKIHDLVAYFYEWGIALGGLVVFVALLIAGFLYLTSVGDPNKMKDAKGRIKHALGGLVLLLLSWLILHTINPELTKLEEIQFRVKDTPRPFPITEELTRPVHPCTRVILFDQPNFEGRTVDIAPGQRWLMRLFTPESFVFCRKKTEEERKKVEKGEQIKEPGDKCPKEDEIEGGACELQLYERGGFLGIFGCGVPALTSPLLGPRHNNLNDIYGLEAIGCVELIPHGIEGIRVRPETPRPARPEDLPVAIMPETPLYRPEERPFDPRDPRRGTPTF